jgi:hypothetical protein
VQRKLAQCRGIASLAVLVLSACADTTPTSPASSPIPDGAIWLRETIRRSNPPSGFTAVAGWLQAATMTSTQAGSVARLTIDYMRLIVRRADGSEHVVSQESYDVSQPYLRDGGLFRRSPHWFGINDATPIYNSVVRDGFLVIDVSATPDNIVHWWTNRVSIDPGSRAFLEISLMIEGRVGFQMGADYWVDLTSEWNGYDQNCQGVNNCEAWVSDWYGDTHGQFVTIRAPIH